VRTILVVLLAGCITSVFCESLASLGINDQVDRPNVLGHSSAPVPAFQSHTGKTRLYPRTGPLVFELKELIKHPFYFWPETLISYPVSFEARAVRADQLSLFRTDQPKQEPFQLTNVKTEKGLLKSAVVHFLSDLPSGSTKRFELRVEETGHRKEIASDLSTVDGQTIILSTGETRIRIPATQEIEGTAPGPIVQLGWGDRWFGSSKMVSNARKVLRIRTTLEESGPLFLQYSIAYEFDRGARYIATIRCIKRYEFFPFHERTEGISNEEGIYFETLWTGFNPTHREGPNHPWVPLRYTPHRMNLKERPPFTAHKWERIDDPIVSDRQGVWQAFSKEGELSFRLGPYGMRTTYVILTSSSFWDERTNNSIGILADHVDTWADNYYAIWSSSDIHHVRYFYKNNTLSWTWPIANGTRQTGILAYDHAKDIRATERQQDLYRKVDGGDYFLGLKWMDSHTQYLRNRYAPLNLNRVKDYVLEYGRNLKGAKNIFGEGQIRTSGDFVKRLFSEDLLRELPMHGGRTDTGFSAVHTRAISNFMTDSYLRFNGELNEEDRSRVTAAYLMLAYQVAEDDFQPLRPMLGGNPNFMADVKGGIAFFSYLFPDHPKAREWADTYEKFLDIGFRYMTRPAVDEWDSKGGRWSENLGSYVWAALRPTLKAATLLQKFGDGRNRLATPHMVELGDWLVNAVGAPASPLSRGRRGDGASEQTISSKPARVYPPQGAHAARRVPPRDLWLLGSLLHNYAPLKAEHMMYTANPGSSERESDVWSQVLFNGLANRGTNPHLKSSKYTGYGVVLRSGVDTTEELSVHLQQIDNGPNYRWGMPGEGSNGNIYFYAAGKSYTHNGSEDSGDRRAAATDYNSSFAVWKDNGFRSIGKNFLTEPMYDLGSAQYASIKAREGRYSFAHPQYLSRSVLLSGGDYFAISDDTFSSTVRYRFSWFTALNDAMPYLHFVNSADTGQSTEIKTGVTKGLWYEGSGDSLVIVTHKPEIEAKATVYGAHVRGIGFEDMLFREPDGINYSEAGKSFKGTAGLIRQKGTKQELVIFHGTRIESGILSLKVGHSDLGVSVEFENVSQLRGRTYTQRPGSLKIEWMSGLPAGSFYIDGVRQKVSQGNKSLLVQIPEGNHMWEFTSGEPTPPAPEMLRTENFSGGAKIFFKESAGATSYRIELSSDNGTTWRQAGITKSSPYLLSGVKNGEKLHVRAISFNSQRESLPAAEYPLYISNKAPGIPDGLRIRNGKGATTISWGEVLGASEYRLYRRKKNENSFRLIYKGLSRSFSDSTPGVIPVFEIPGEEGTINHYNGSYTVYEYVVTSVNGNGESDRSSMADTDPSSWRNWEPVPGERFRYRHNIGGERDGLRMIDASNSLPHDYIEL
jgi:hypothetical protein